MRRAGNQVGGMSTGGFVHRFADGGRVPGYGGGDKVPAVLEPGEFVIAKNVASRYYSELERLNRGRVAYDGTFENVLVSDLVHRRNRVDARGNGNVWSGSEALPVDYIRGEISKKSGKDISVISQGLVVRNVYGGTTGVREEGFRFWQSGGESKGDVLSRGGGGGGESKGDVQQYAFAHQQ